MSVRGPTRQQKLFVDNYLKHRKKNATQAAVDSGYSSKSASSQAYQLLQNPIVLEYLEHREKQLEKELRREFFFDAIEARNVMYSIMDDPNSKDSDRLSAAKDFLDRAGFKPKSEVNVSGDVGLGIHDKKDLAQEFIKGLMSDDQGTG